MTGKQSSNLVSFKESRNRRSATDELHKIKKTSKGKLGRKSNHTGSSKRTHTTLRCCVGRHVGNPQKTAVLAPSQICRGLPKAPLCLARTYRDLLLSTFINNLNYRRPLPLANAQGA